VSVRRADYDRPETLADAFAGAARMLLISTTPEAPYPPGKRLGQHKRAIDAAVAAGVAHILYTSAPNPEPGTPCFWKADHYGTELALLETGRDWTILRNWEYPDWHLAQIWAPALEAGTLFAATGDGRCAYVTRKDCARAAAGALVSPNSAGRRFDVTGAYALAIGEVMALLGRVRGRSVRVVQVSEDEYRTQLAARGENPHLIPVHAAFALAVKQGRFDRVTDAVEELTGRAPRTLHEFFVANHAQAAA
jgi:NAD(P)H dehydrogenase (quinone)